MILLVVVLVLLWIGSLPAWPYSRAWGYLPSSGIAIILAIVVLLLITHVV
jgi:low affinity Fe/Cu permease